MNRVGIESAAANGRNMRYNSNRLSSGPLSLPKINVPTIGNNGPSNMVVSQCFK